MQISEAEAIVMDVLWASSPRAAEEVVAALSGLQDWQEATIKTLLNRLLNKGAIQAERDGRRYLYSPVLRREDYVRSQSEGLLDRLFGGRLAPLVAQFSEQRGLKREDIAELRELLDRLEDESPTTSAGQGRTNRKGARDEH
ncbi:MAG TPA: BlaI/MecI/CopY family transcriptional regulator [Aquimonas sp.]|jgi:BlaI family transcriptional regulator, penicillinase repressor|nr:BlaI/MecI/CopY family transcriptional regulator [Xanthomonadales bacterium]HRD71650.1 BlaI/MecI/CopY family transcriptional regulator [Aquimonas sp.]HRF53026.1 BlaI/MecI/CopY family transcriptional regulator [Aquimonas sp.]